MSKRLKTERSGKNESELKPIRKKQTNNRIFAVNVRCASCRSAHWCRAWTVSPAPLTGRGPCLLRYWRAHADRRPPAIHPSERRRSPDDVFTSLRTRGSSLSPFMYVHISWRFVRVESTVFRCRSPGSLAAGPHLMTRSLRLQVSRGSLTPRWTFRIRYLNETWRWCIVIELLSDLTWRIELVTPRTWIEHFTIVLHPLDKVLV